jgi:fused signal recognition particle receptor
LNGLLQQEIEKLLVDAPEQSYRDFSTPSGNKPYVILVVGVNGVGKTTTIGKLAYNFKRRENRCCWAPPIRSGRQPSIS